MNEWEWQLLEDRTPMKSLEIAGVRVGRGDRVTLRPREGGDIFDLALAGKIAIVESIEQDYEGNLHVCVVLDDDPGRDLGLMRQPGHRFFFSSSEVAPVGDGRAPREPHGSEDSAEMSNRILIAGIGNIFLADDAFGVAVANRLRNHSFPRGVRVTDFGIRGFDLASALVEGYQTTILVDAYPGDGPPGTLFVVEPDLAELHAGSSPATLLEPHAMNPLNVLRAAAGMGATLNRVLLVGCVPETLGPDEGQMGLSAPVTAAIEEAVKLIDRLVTRILAGEWPAEK
jgi:hydrogenase maturation protease